MALIGVRSKSFRLPLKKKNALRFFNLTMDLGTEAVRQHFNVLVPPDKLEGHLAAHKERLLKLLKQKVLKKGHGSILFPTQKRVTSKDFDLMLLICLIRNTTTEAPPPKGWDELPDECTITKGADIARIKYYRNEYLAHKPKQELSNAEFQTASQSLIGAITRLSKWNLTSRANEWKNLDIGDEEYRDIFKNYVEVQKEKKAARKHIQALRRYIVDTWKKEETLFVETEAYRYALEQCKKHNFITISGVSGAGKSTMAYNIAIQLEKEGYTILPVTNISEIKKYHNFSESQVFILDDPLGLASFDSTKAEDVRSQSSAIDEKFLLGDSKIIFTSRRHIIDNIDVSKDKSIVYRNVVDLHNVKIQLSHGEKEQMFEKHTRNLERSFDPIEILRDDQLNFPLLCKMFSCNESFQKEGKAFFTDPISAIIYNIKQYKKDSRPEYMALLLCAVCDGYVDTEDLQKGAYEEQIDLLYSALNSESNLSPVGIQEAMHRLENVYFVKEKSCFRFIHESLFEAVLYHFAKEYEGEMLRCFPLSFVQRYLVIVKSHGGQLSANECSVLAERHINEIRKGNFLDVFLNPYFEEDDILISFIKKLELLNSSELTHLMLGVETQVNEDRMNFVKRENIWNRMTALNIILERKDVKAFHWIIVLNMSILFYYIWSRLDSFPGRQNVEQPCISFLHAGCLGGNKEIVAMLLKTGNVGHLKDQCEPLKTSALHMAVYSRNPDMVNMVVESTITSLIDIQNLFESTPLFESAAMGLKNTCIALLEKKADVHILSKGSLSPLWIAAHEGHTEIVKILLDHGVYTFINQGDEDGATPLYIAAEKGQEEVVKILLANGAEVNLCDKENVSPLYIAAQNGFTNIVKLLSNNKANQAQRENNGESALYIAARNGHKDVVQVLLEKGASINLCDNDGVSPLNIACHNGHVETVKVFLKYNAAVNQLDRQRISPLYIASQNGHAKTVEVLLENVDNIADINLRDSHDVSPLYIASHNEHIDTVVVLLKHKAIVDQCTDDGATPLYIAAFRGNTTILERLLEHGAKVNTCDNNNVSPLYMAAQNGHMECVRLMLEHGADVNIADHEGIAPLYIAVQNGHTEVVDILLANGADVNQSDHDGVSPLNVAIEREYQDIISLLKTAQCKQEINLSSDSRGTTQ